MLFAKKCPMCSTKMSKINGVLTCPICGYSESSHSSPYITSGSGEITKNTKASTSTNTNTSTNTSENSRSYKQTPDATSGSPQSSNAGSQQSNTRPYRQYPTTIPSKTTTIPQIPPKILSVQKRFPKRRFLVRLFV